MFYNPNLIVPYQEGDEESDFALKIKKCRKPKQTPVKKAEKLTKTNLKRLNAKRDK